MGRRADRLIRIRLTVAFVTLLLTIVWCSAALAQRRYEVGFVQDNEPAWVAKNDTIDVFFTTSRESLIDSIDQQLALPDSERHLMVLGQIALGTYDNNYRYHWHFKDIGLAQFAIEICDGDPRFVDQMLDTYLYYGFCPWSSFVKREVQLASVIGGSSIQTIPQRTSNRLLLASNAHADYQIFDPLGRVVRSGSTNNGEIWISTLPPGLYLLSTLSSGRTTNSKFIR